MIRDARRAARAARRVVASGGTMMRLALALLISVAIPATGWAQTEAGTSRGDPRTLPVASAPVEAPSDALPASLIPIDEDADPLRPARTFRSRADSLDFERARGSAERARGFRVVVELFERTLHVIDGADTVLAAPIAVGMSDSVLAFGDRLWRFDTPRGRRTVLRKEESPVWVPPDWHYVEVAAQLGLELQPLHATRPHVLSDGRVLEIRDGYAGLLADGVFEPLPADEQIIFDDTLFMPPFGTENRRIPGELGRFRLDLGNGYLLHGTPHEYTIGSAATHGCIRLFDEDIEWMFLNVPVGTAVYIY